MSIKQPKKQATKEQVIIARIYSRENAQAQLSQMLRDELKSEHIQGYELETIKD